MGPPDSLCCLPGLPALAEPFPSIQQQKNRETPEFPVCFSPFLRFRWDVSLLHPLLKGWSVSAPSHTRAVTPPCQASREHKRTLQAAMPKRPGKSSSCFIPPAPHGMAQTHQEAFVHTKPPLLLSFPSVAMGTPWGHISQAATEE